MKDYNLQDEEDDETNATIHFVNNDGWMAFVGFQQK